MENKELALLGEISRLYLEKATGELLVKGEAFEKKVYFEQGRIIFAVSNLPQDSLGNLLIEAEKISPEQLIDAEKLMNACTMLGTVLVYKGFLSPEDLYWGIKFQATRIIYSLFQLEGLDYSFKQRELERDEVLRLNFQTPNIVMEGARRMGSAILLRQVLNLKSYIKFMMDGPDQGKGIDFLPKEKEILPLLNGRYSIRKLIGLGLMEELELLRMLNGLQKLHKLIVSDDPMAAETPPPVSALAAVSSQRNSEGAAIEPALPPDFFFRNESSRISALDRQLSFRRNAKRGGILAVCAVLAVIAAFYYRSTRSRPSVTGSPVSHADHLPSGPVTPPAQSTTTVQPQPEEIKEDASTTSTPPPPPQATIPEAPGAVIQLQDVQFSALANGGYRIGFRLVNSGELGSELRGFLFLIASSADGSSKMIYPADWVVSDMRLEFRRGISFRISRYKQVDTEFQVPFVPVLVKIHAFDRDGREVFSSDLPL